MVFSISSPIQSPSATSISSNDKSTISIPAGEKHNNATGLLSLFDGKTPNGWIQILANSWEVNDGIITSLDNGRGVLYITNQYDHNRLMFSVYLKSMTTSQSKSIQQLMT